MGSKLHYIPTLYDSEKVDSFNSLIVMSNLAKLKSVSDAIAMRLHMHDDVTRCSCGTPAGSDAWMKQLARILVQGKSGVEDSPTILTARLDRETTLMPAVPT